MYACQHAWVETHAALLITVVVYVLKFVTTCLCETFSPATWLGGMALWMKLARKFTLTRASLFKPWKWLLSSEIFFIENAIHGDVQQRSNASLVLLTTWVIAINYVACQRNSSSMHTFTKEDIVHSKRKIHTANYPKAILWNWRNTSVATKLCP